jgi:4-aminobutyrate aminotransferase
MHAICPENPDMEEQMSKNNVPIPEIPEGFEESVASVPAAAGAFMEARAEGDTNQGDWRREWALRTTDPETRRLLAEDARLFLHQSLSTPCLDVVESADGATLHCRGGDLLDFHGNNVHQVGHAHPAVVAAVKAQLDRLAFCPRRFTNAAAVELADRLVRLAPPPLGKVLLAPGGAEAMSMAVRLARLATGRYKTISFWDSFHGATLDTIAIGGERLFRDGMEPLHPGALHAPPPVVPPSHRESPAIEAMRDPDYLDYLMRKEGGVGAVVAEPFRYALAMDPPPDYWQQVRRICRRHQALLIFDEMPVCLGRSGHWFACQRYDVAPDILVIGKGLGGGIFPLAAILADPALDIAGHTAVGHFTHEKSPVGAAAALAAIQVIEEEDLVRQARCKGRRVLEALAGLKQRHRGIGMVAGIGLQLAVELVDAAGRPDAGRAEQVLYRCLAGGLSFKIAGGNVLSLSPPLNVAEHELCRAVDILDAALDDKERNTSES